jgi:hypothetical protein
MVKEASRGAKPALSVAIALEVATTFEMQRQRRA